SDRPRVAAISNFGFGGNDAHLLLEQDGSPDEGARAWIRGRTQVAVPRPETPRIAIVGIEVLAGGGKGLADFAADLFFGRTRVRGAGPDRQARADDVELRLMGLRFPPCDLAEALPQQTFTLKAVANLLERTGPLPR